MAGIVFGIFLGLENEPFMLNIGTGFASDCGFDVVICYDVEFAVTYEFVQIGSYATAVKVAEPATLALFAIGLAGPPNALRQYRRLTPITKTLGRFLKLPSVLYRAAQPLRLPR